MGQPKRTMKGAFDIAIASIVALIICALGFALGYFAGPTKTKTVQDTRARIHNGATLHTAQDSFRGKPYVTGQLIELPGLNCKGYTNGKGGNGWVAILCTTGPAS